MERSHRRSLRLKKPVVRLSDWEAKPQARGPRTRASVRSSEPRILVIVVGIRTCGARIHGAGAPGSHQMTPLARNLGEYIGKGATEIMQIHMQILESEALIRVTIFEVIVLVGRSASLLYPVFPNLILGFSS